MNKTIRLALTAIVLACFGMPVLAVHQLVLKDVAEVSGWQVRLKDLLVESPDGAALPLQLRELVVATVAHVDQPLKLRAAHLERVIARLQPGYARHLRWRGSDTVSVILPGVSTPLAEINASASRFLVAELRARGHEFSLRDISARPRSQTIPAGKLALTPRFDRPLRLGQAIRLVVTVSVDGRHIENVPVAATVTVMAPAYRATRSLQAGESLRREDFITLGAVEAQWDSPLLTNRAEGHVLNSRLKKALAQGDLLRESDLEDAPLVARAQEVSAERRTPTIVVERRVVAEADGFLGGRIKVSDPVSGISFFAKVIAPGRVEVQ